MIRIKHFLSCSYVKKLFQEWISKDKSTSTHNQGGYIWFLVLASAAKFCVENFFDQEKFGLIMLSPVCFLKKGKKSQLTLKGFVFQILSLFTFNFV